MHYLLDATLFLGLMFVLLFVGWRTRRAGQPLVESLVICSTCILGLTAFLLWLLGSTLGLPSYLSPVVLLAVIASVFIWGIRPSRNSSEKSSDTRVQTLLTAPLDKALVLYLVVVSATTFILTLAPPNTSDYDSLVYHLASPAQYLRLGRILELPYDHHSYFPFTVEILYTLGLQVRSAVFAKLFHWLMLPLSCLAIVAIGQRQLTLRAGLLGAALWASLPVVQAEASTAYIDLGLATFTLCAVLAFLNWQQNSARRDLLLSGLFCGFCLGTKYLGALTFGWIFLWAAVFVAKRKSTDGWKSLGGFTGIALLVGGGWYLRNWLWTGNPVYPFAYEVFGGKGWTAEMAKAYSRDQAAYGFGKSLADFIMLPWRLSMTPLNLGYIDGKFVGLGFWPFTEAVTADGTGATGARGMFETGGMLLSSMIGPMLLALGLPLLAFKKKPGPVGFVLWTFAFFWVFWSVTGQYLRYLVPAYAVLCIACGWGASAYLSRGALLRWTAAIALSLWLLATPCMLLKNAGGSFPVITGRETPEAYLQRSFSGYEAMRRASQETPVNARFAVWGEPRCFYLERDYFWADDEHNNLIDYASIENADGLISQLKQLGATHVLWNSAAVQNGGFGTPPPQLQQAIDAGRLRPLFEGNRSYRVLVIE
jgi:hypothetical protein